MVDSVYESLSNVTLKVFDACARAHTMDLEDLGLFSKERSMLGLMAF